MSLLCVRRGGASLLTPSPSSAETFRLSARLNHEAQHPPQGLPQTRRARGRGRGHCAGVSKVEQDGTGARVSEAAGREAKV